MSIETFLRLIRSIKTDWHFSHGRIRNSDNYCPIEAVFSRPGTRWTAQKLGLSEPDRMAIVDAADSSSINSQLRTDLIAACWKMGE